MSINEENRSIINDSSLDIINRIIKVGKNYGKSSYGNKKKISISVISGNDNLDIRNIIYEDSMANILFFTGFDVTRGYYGNNIYIEEYKKELDSIRISFDNYTNEELLCSKGIVDDVLSKLQRSGKCYIDNDSLWLKTTDLGDYKDRLLVNSDGTYTSILLCISYILDRLNNGYDKVIDIISNNSNEYIKIIKSCIEIAGYDSSKYEIISINNYSIVKYNEEYKFNSIKNLKDVIDVNRIRYSFINEEFSNELNINLDLLKENNIDNSIYYIEKVYTKMCAILRGKSYENDGTIDNDSAYTILNRLSYFEKVIIYVINKREPSIMASYLYELASLFNNYNSDKDIDKRLIAAVRIVIDNASNMLGIILREEI